MNSHTKMPTSKDARPISIDPRNFFKVTDDELKLLFQKEHDPEAKTNRTLTLITAFLTPITLIGMLQGFKRGYERFMYPKRIMPEIHLSPPIVRLAMVVGAIRLWAVIIGLLIVGGILLSAFMPRDAFATGRMWLIMGYLGANLIMGFIIRGWFQRWQIGINNALIVGKKFGTARFAYEDELQGYKQKGLYIGGGYTLSDKGHILTVAGTRGGKGTNLIIPNLLGVGGYQGSWVVIDPKGENAAITARYQRENGQNVVVLNPWGLLEDNIGQAQSYNPLDILADTSNINLVDDAQMIAEMIVPIDKNDRNKFFTDNARAIVAGLLLHMATDYYPYEDEALVVASDITAPPERQLRAERSLTTLWQWVRLPEDKWIDLIADMSVNEHKLFSSTVKQAAHEIGKLMQAGDKTWGNIIATVLQCTDFIKSPALQKSMQTGFDPKTLSDGKTTLYVIIPADKLQSHARWLRLVVTTTMRAVVRKPNKRVCFLLDEFAALGYLPEIETALSTYAGFEITVWPILQSLIQLQSHYKDNWETFVGNSTIRQFFSINDNFTAEYCSKAIGATSHVINYGSGLNIEKSEANQRYLVTPDELRRGSGTNIFAFIADKPVTYYPKLPYYEMPTLKINGKARYDDNPYFKTA